MIMHMHARTGVPSTVRMLAMSSASSSARAAIPDPCHDIDDENAAASFDHAMDALSQGVLSSMAAVLQLRMPLQPVRQLYLLVVQHHRLRKSDVQTSRT